MEARGGTEIALDDLRHFVGPGLVDAVHIAWPLPERVALHPDKSNIV